MKRIALPAALALCAGMGATTAQAAALAAPRPCIGAMEAQSLLLVLAPEAIRALSTTCASTLPPNALIRQPDGPLVQKFQAEADRAWPDAKGALTKLAGPEAAPLIGSDMGRSMLGALVGPMITAKIKPVDCPAIEAVVSLVAPLPPRNMAALIVTILQLAGDKKENGLPICPMVSK